MGCTVNEVVLIFPDNYEIIDFLWKYHIANVEVHAREHTISGILTDKQICIAYREYKAVLCTEVESFSSAG